MGDGQLSLLDDSDYEAIAAEMGGELEGTAAPILEVEDQRDIPAEVAGEIVDETDREEIFEEIKAEREAEAIPEERKDEERRPVVLSEVYSEGTWAIALWISFTVSGLTLALYLLASYAPLFWISAFFAAIWFVLLVISRFIPRSSA